METIKAFIFAKMRREQILSLENIEEMQKSREN